MPNANPARRSTNCGPRSPRRAPICANRWPPPAAGPAVADGAPRGRPLTPLRDEEFDARLDRLGPFEPAPHLAVAASGGADSTALALLAAGWVRRRNGVLTALVVDHGIRASSPGEARVTVERLAARGIPSHVLTLGGLQPGHRLAERARDARYTALESACARLGIIHLLLGHHSGDQAETVLMRREAGSGPRGLAAMPALRETAHVRLLRPLLDIPASRLRATLRETGMDWVEDPSNSDPAALRTRLRARLATGDEAALDELLSLADACASERRIRDLELADMLATRVAFRPEGFALIRAGPIDPDALGAVLRVVAGRAYDISPRRLARLACGLAPATLGGAQIVPAGKLLPGGWLAVREPAAMQSAAPAERGAVWDGRWRLTASWPGGSVGALGSDAARLRQRSELPSSVLRTLPAVRAGGAVVVVPCMEPLKSLQNSPFSWSPPTPAACAPFKPSAGKC